MKNMYLCPIGFSAVGQTATLGNFAKATYYAIQRTYSYLTPDLWTTDKDKNLPKNPMDQQISGGPAVSWK